jgi:hypothetical protein
VVKFGVSHIGGFVFNTIYHTCRCLYIFQVGRSSKKLWVGLHYHLLLLQEYRFASAAVLQTVRHHRETENVPEMSQKVGGKTGLVIHRPIGRFQILNPHDTSVD